jgi:hypothetical protein
MTLRNLIKSWEQTASNPMADNVYPIKLTKADSAKVAALAEMYPARTPEQILTELIGAALKELEYALPYIRGEKVATLDELGDPIYEDVGPAPRFAELTRKYLRGENSSDQTH